MKIAHINSVFGIGSTGKIVEVIHRELLSEGHKSIAFCGRSHPVFNADIPHESVVDTYSISSIAHHVASGVFFDRHGLYSKSQTQKIIDRLEEFSPEILHLHNLHGFYLNYELLFNYINTKSFKVVWTMHDAWAFTGFCSHYTYNKCNEWETGCNECRYKDIYPYRCLSNSKANYKKKKSLFTECCFKIVSPSLWLKEQLDSSFLKDKEKQIIQNGVSLEQFYEDKDVFELDEKYTLHGKRVLLSISNGWTKQKGFCDLLDLSKELSTDDTLVLVGVSRKQVKVIENYRNIIGMEKTQDVAELRKWYNRAAVFINLSLDDTFPTVNIEAIACGTPLITYDEGGASELGKRYGQVLKRGEIRRIPEMLKELGVTKINREEFAKESMINQYIKLYEELRESR